MPEGFRFYDLRHIGHILSTQNGVTLKDTMVRAGQSSEKGSTIYQYSILECQREVTTGIEARAVAERQAAEQRSISKADDRTGTQRARDR